MQLTIQTKNGTFWPSIIQVTDDWAAQTETSDWAAQSAPAGEAAAPAQTWGGSSQWS